MIRKSFFVAALCLMSRLAASAHQPHDIVDSLDLSPAFADDQTLFYSTGYDLGQKLLFKSSDGGRSRRIVANGLDNVAALTCIAVSPNYSEDHTVFVASQDNGLYRSTDGGASWTNVNRGPGAARARSLAVSPGYKSDGLVFSIDRDGGIHKSADRGQNWKRVAMEEGAGVNVISYRFSGKKLEIFAGVQNGILYVSGDLGESWKRLYNFGEAGGPVTAIEFASGDVFVGTGRGGMYRSRNGGRGFRAINDGLTDTSITSIAVSPEYEKDGALFCSTWREGVFYSGDRGKSWRRRGKGLVTDKQANDPDVGRPQFGVLKISKSYGRDKTLFLAGFCGLFKSTDGANSWTELETWWPKAIYGFAISPAFAQDSTLAVATQYDGAYVSQDRGKSWERMNDGLSFMIDRHLLDIQFSPAFRTDKTLFSVSPSYLFKLNMVDKKWRRHGLWMPALPPYPFPSVIAPSPKYNSDQTLYAGTRSSGVFVSNDAGRSWRNVFVNQSTLPYKFVISLAVSPGFSADRELYAGFFGTGEVYKSADGGQTWKLAYRAYGRSEAALSPQYPEDRTLFVFGSAGLSRSADRGEKWEELSVAAGGRKMVNAAALSPAYSTDKTLLVSLNGMGLFLSVDGGEHFARVGASVMDGYDAPKNIRFSPQYLKDRTVYAASYEELFVSVDGGETWSALSWADAPHE